uniref:Transmembrane 9 superfamily member n=1 Tax=Paramormyrops kingsleyae TaxID=1676925 RepID=A0A3B3RNU7_9TELE
ESETSHSEKLGQFKFKVKEECTVGCTKTYNKVLTEDPTREHTLLNYLKYVRFYCDCHDAAVRTDHLCRTVGNMPVTWRYDAEVQQNSPKDVCVVNVSFVLYKKMVKYFYLCLSLGLYPQGSVNCTLSSKVHIFTFFLRVIQWFSIMNSLVIVLFLSSTAAAITQGTLLIDIARYCQMDSVDAQEEFGLKLEYGDVFQPARMGTLLSVFPGSGTQIFIIFARLISLSPAKRGGPCDVCCGAVETPAAYVAARFYKSHTLAAFFALLFHTSFRITFLHFIAISVILWENSPSADISFRMLVTILDLWFCVSVPLTFLGGIEHPVRTNQIPCQIPEQSFYTKSLPGIQFFFTLNSIWSVEPDVLFVRILFLVLIILVITCSEATILLCYFQPHSLGAHRRSTFLLPPSSLPDSPHFCYSIQYCYSKLRITRLTGTILCFGYTMIMALIFFLFTGTVGFFASVWFVTNIYSVVTVD